MWKRSEKQWKNPYLSFLGRGDTEGEKEHRAHEMTGKIRQEVRKHDNTYTERDLTGPRKHRAGS